MPRTLPASKLLLLAATQAEQAHRRTMNEILALAVEEHPELRGGELDLSTGMWTLPDASPAE
jgi:hypothetical protein